jgi:hypothetical protein
VLPKNTATLYNHPSLASLIITYVVRCATPATCALQTKKKPRVRLHVSCSSTCIGNNDPHHPFPVGQAKQTPRFPCDIRALREQSVNSRSPRPPTGRFLPHGTTHLHTHTTTAVFVNHHPETPPLPSSFAAAEHPHPPTVGFRRPKDRRPIHHWEVRSLIPRHCIPSVLATSFTPPRTTTNVCCFLFSRGNMRPTALPARPVCTIALPHRRIKSPTRSP